MTEPKIYIGNEEIKGIGNFAFSNIRLNLGCGDKKIDGYINIDADRGCRPDLVHDLTLALPYKTNTVDEVRAFDILEHIPPGDVIFLMNEIWRVLKPGGRFEHFTPSTDGRGAFQDPTHVSFWNMNSWFYYCPEMVGGRRFYNIKAQFHVEVLRDILTDDRNRVIHTHGIMTAIKEQSH